MLTVCKFSARFVSSKALNQKEMLEFTKRILTKVSFDRLLFKKELKKAVKWLSKDELHQLKVWCQQRFGSIYGDVINETFAAAAI